MKFLLHILFLFSFWSCFSQKNFDTIPENAKEIHFVYEIKSRYLINDADALLFKIDFPNLKYSLRKKPTDTLTNCGFSTLKNFTLEELKKLKAIIYHTNETIFAVNFIASKKTVFKVIRGNDETKLIFKKYFNERFVNFKYRQEFNFVKRTEKRKYPNVNYNLTFDKISKNLEFKNEDDFGFYYETKNNLQFKNLVLFDKKLSKYISPKVFENNNFGIKEIETVQETITLKSVVYK